MNLTPRTLLASQIVAHIATIYWFVEYFTWSSALLVFVVYFFTGCVGMSITFHRLLTHRSFKTSKLFEYFGTFCATVGLTGSSISWTAAHRQHHTKTDKAGDPHSPLILGYFTAQFLSMFSSIDIKRSPVLTSNFHRFFHKYYLAINVTWGLMLYVFFGIWGVLTLYLVPACLLWNAGSLINTIGHTPILGYVRYNVNDRSTNNPFLGVFMWGEGWHNNHHRFQNRANIGEKWWEIDIGYWVIKLISKSN